MLRGSPYHVITCAACAELCRACEEACRGVTRRRAARPLRGCVRFVRRSRAIAWRRWGATSSARGITRMRHIQTFSSSSAGRLLAVVACGSDGDADAQASQRGQPETPFGVADLGKLQWLEGTWEGTSPGERDVLRALSSSRTIRRSRSSTTGTPALARQTGTRTRLSLASDASITRSDRAAGARRTSTSTACIFVPQVSAQQHVRVDARSHPTRGPRRCESASADTSA